MSDNNNRQITTDALIIGAGPIGLFQAFELGLLGISCHIVEALDQAGGQCSTLYPDKPIYDIPGTAFTSASDFIDQLLQQIKPFDPQIHLNCTVLNISRRGDHFVVSTNSQTEFIAVNIFVATGAGAFTPVKLRDKGFEEFETTQVHYNTPAATLLENKNVVVTGDDSSAVQTALQILPTADTVTLVHRKRRFDINEDTSAGLQRAIDNGSLKAIKGKITSFTVSNSQLQTIVVQQNADSTDEIKLDHLLVRLGNSPKQSALQDWGIPTTANHIPVDTANFESQCAGVYAIGDINIYPAKRKLILCGFHEATLAAFAAAARAQPDKPIHLQYTTTSTELRKRLGVL